MTRTASRFGGPVAVVGSSGTTGGRVTRVLAERGVAVRAIVRSESAGGKALAAGASSVAIGDLLLPGSLPAALHGCSSVYFIAPAFHPDEDIMAANAVEGAERAGVSRFVQHSVLHPFTPTMPHHVRKARAEVVVRASDLLWTILQPAIYAQSIFRLFQSRAADQPVTVPWSLESRFCPIHLGDVARVAAMVLIDTGHEYAGYELAGPEVLTTREMIDQISQIMGESFEVRSVPPTEIAPPAWPAQLPAEMTAMRTEYDHNGLVGNSSVLRWLLGREPTTFADAYRQDNAVL